MKKCEWAQHSNLQFTYHSTQSHVKFNKLYEDEHFSVQLPKWAAMMLENVSKLAANVGSKVWTCVACGQVITMKVTCQVNTGIW